MQGPESEQPPGGPDPVGSGEEVEGRRGVWVWDSWDSWVAASDSAGLGEGVQGEGDVDVGGVAGLAGVESEGAEDEV